MKWIINITRILFLGLFLYLILTGNMFLWLALFGASLIAAIFFGRIYCGYVCPMNTVLIPIEWLSKRLKFKQAIHRNGLKRASCPGLRLESV
jgi:polyferredoxin